MRISPRLISSAALAALFGWLLAWRPLSWPGPVEPCLLQVTASAPGGAFFTAHLDEGHGYSLGTTTDLFKRFPAAGGRGVIAIPLPPTRLRELKLEVFGAAEVTLSSVRLIQGDKLLADCFPNLHPDSASVGALTPTGLVLRPALAGGLIGVKYQPARSLLLPAGDEPWLIEELAYFFLLTALFAVGQHFLARRLASGAGARLMAKAAAVSSAVQRRPVLFLAGVGLCASIVSSYPVALCGRSFVSPNNFPFLLYNRSSPTIPGIRHEPTKDFKDADITALMLYHLPCSAVEHDALFRDHELPLWNRYSTCGLPLFGQGQSMFGDPLHFLPIVANAASWAWDLKFLLAKALFSFGIGLCVWALTRRLDVAALLGASAAWIGFFAFRFNHPAFFSLCYSPWVLLPWLRAASMRSKRDILLLAAGLVAADWCELTSGTAKEASMLLLSLNAAGFFAALCASAGWRQRWRTVAAPLAASVLFLPLSAPHWLVFLDALHQAATVYDLPTAYQLPPGLLAGFFDDIFSQDFTPKEWHSHPSANFFALTGVLWLAASWRRHRGDRPLVALAVAALGLAALVFGVVPPAWIERTPFLGNIFHIQNTFGCPLLVLTLILAGVGLADCLSRAAAPEWSDCYRRTLVGLALLLALYLGTTQAILPSPNFLTSTPPWHSVFFVGYASVLVATAALVPQALRWTQLEGMRRPAGRFIVGVCLVFLHFRHGMYLQTRFDDYVMTPRLRFDLAAQSPSLADLRRRLDEPARTTGFDLTLAPGYNALLRLEGLAGLDALYNRYNRELYDAARVPRSGDWWVLVHERDLRRLKPFYDALNLRYYLRERNAGVGLPPGLDFVGAADLALFESKQVWPRAFFADHPLHYGKLAELVTAIAHGDGRPFAAIQDPAAAALSAAAPERKIVPAANYRLTTNTTEFTVAAPGPGIIVLGENYEEGSFRVTMNGLPTPYVRVNHTFKGVTVEKAGTYRLRFEYWPRLLTPALWMSAAGAALALLSAGAFWRYRRSASCSGADAEFAHGAA